MKMRCVKNGVENIMRRTLLAVGFAVLVSTLLAPHRNGWSVLAHAFSVTPGSDPLGYGYTPHWCYVWRWFPAFWIEDGDGFRDSGNPVLWTQLIAQTVFVAVLAVYAREFAQATKQGNEAGRRKREKRCNASVVYQFDKMIHYQCVL
jgi:hypothetical protein